MDTLMERMLSATFVACEIDFQGDMLMRTVAMPLRGLLESSLNFHNNLWRLFRTPRVTLEIILIGMHIHFISE